MAHFNDLTIYAALIFIGNNKFGTFNLNLKI